MSNKKQYNKVIAHLKPTGKRMVRNYATQNEMSESRVAAMAIKQFFDAMPERIKIKYLVDMPK